VPVRQVVIAAEEARLLLNYKNKYHHILKPFKTHVPSSCPSLYCTDARKSSSFVILVVYINVKKVRGTCHFKYLDI